jgi:hypothetical protein
MKNTEISKLLGEEWKKAPAEVRKPHIDKELRDREAYHKKTLAWRQQRRNEEDSARQQRIAVAERLVLPRMRQLPTTSPIPSTPPSSSLGTTFNSRETPILPKPSFSQEDVPKAIAAPIQKSSPVHQQAGRPTSPDPWDEMNLGYNGVEESLIPTILPSPHPPHILRHRKVSMPVDQASPSKEDSKLEPHFPFGKKMSIGLLQQKAMDAILSAEEHIFYANLHLACFSLSPSYHSTYIRRTTGYRIISDSINSRR